jgi:hypothetical protein
MSNFSINEELFTGTSMSKFHDPFLTPSTESMPRQFESALDLCLFLYYLNPAYRMATRRVVAHFVTDFEFTDNESKTEQDSLRSILKDSLGVLNALMEAGEEGGCYGNSFWRIHFPFDRYLIDRRDGNYVEYALDMFGDNVEFSLDRMEYTVWDPRLVASARGNKETAKVTLPFRDKAVKDVSRIKLRKLDPKRVTLQHSWISGTTRVIYRFEEWFIQQIKEGRLYQVNETPVSMLKAIKANQDYLFFEDEVFHHKAPTISGLSNNGWGLPETIANYRTIHQLQVYRKIDEAVGMDYMLPFRIFSPLVSPGVQDSVVQMLMQDWGGNIGELIRRRRKDPYAIHAFPFPVNYNEHGAQGKNLTPKDLIQYQTADMLDSMGYPQELFKGSLQIQSVPTALRLFEQTFHYIHNDFYKFTSWVATKVLKFLGRQHVSVGLKLPSIANDLEAKSQVYLQLSAGGEVSRERAYRSWGVYDPVAEARKRMLEDINIDKERQKIQQDYEREMQMGSADAIIGQQMAQAQAPGPGGAMGAAPQSANQTPLDIMEQAQEKAQQWRSMPIGERKKDMAATEATNPNLYANAKVILDKMRSADESAGRQQGDQAAQQGG